MTQDRRQAEDRHRPGGGAIRTAAGEATFLPRAFAVRLLLMAAEVVLGILRGLLLAPLVGDLRARQIGVFMGSLLLLGLTYLLVGWIRAGTAPRLLGVGLLWVALTVLFEVGLGRLVLGLPWDRLAEDFDLSRGGLLPCARRPWPHCFTAGPTVRGRRRAGRSPIGDAARR